MSGRFTTDDLTSDTNEYGGGLKVEDLAASRTPLGCHAVDHGKEVTVAAGLEQELGDTGFTGLLLVEAVPETRA